MRFRPFALPSWGISPGRQARGDAPAAIPPALGGTSQARRAEGEGGRRYFRNTP
jgi:hypothetical protein